MANPGADLLSLLKTVCAAHNDSFVYAITYAFLYAFPKAYIVSNVYSVVDAFFSSFGRAYECSFPGSNKFPLIISASCAIIIPESPIDNLPYTNSFFSII